MGIPDPVGVGREGVNRTPIVVPLILTNLKIWHFGTLVSALGFFYQDTYCHIISDVLELSRIRAATFLIFRWYSSVLQG